MSPAGERASLEPPLALVTGADGGIGRAVAQRLEQRGYQLLAADHDEQRAAQAVERLGPTAEAVVCDMADPSALAELCRRIEGPWRDRLSVVVANAGMITPGDLVDVEVDSIDSTIAVNLTAVLHLARASVRAFQDSGRGHFLATVSMGGIVAMPGSAAYSASKAGLRAGLAALHAEVAATEIRISGIYPSAVDTPMLRMEARQQGSALNFVGAVHEPADVADAYERALDTGQLEVFVPFHDGLATRVVMLKPSLLTRLMPTLTRLGERGRRRFLERTGGPEPHEPGTPHESGTRDTLATPDHDEALPNVDAH
jgi:short-subunit dehydrogenase